MAGRDEGEEAQVNTRPALPKLIIFYTLFFQLLSTTLLAVLLWFIPTGKEAVEMEMPKIFVLTASVMLCAGILGGSLASFKKQIIIVTTNHYEPHMALSFYLMPVISGTLGIVSFVSLMIIAHILHLNLSSKAAASWMFFTGRMPYVTFALFCGFAAENITSKLRDISQALFTMRRPKAPKPKADDD